MIKTKCTVGVQCSVQIPMEVGIHAQICKRLLLYLICFPPNEMFPLVPPSVVVVRAKIKLGRKFGSDSRGGTVLDFLLFQLCKMSKVQLRRI